MVGTITRVIVDSTELKHNRLQHQLWIMCCETDMYCKWVEIRYADWWQRVRLSACQLSVPPVLLRRTWLRLKLPHFCLSGRPSASLSFHPSLALLTVPSAPSLLSVRLSYSSAVLTAPRPHAVAVFCSVMATGATLELSQTTDRQLLSLSHVLPPQIFFPLKSFFCWTSLTCHGSQSLFLCHLSPSPSSSAADHLVAEGAGRQIGNAQYLEGLCPECLPARPNRLSPPLLHVPHAVPAPRLPCPPAIMCPQKWSSPKLLARDF